MGFGLRDLGLKDLFWASVPALRDLSAKVRL